MAIRRNAWRCVKMQQKWWLVGDASNTMTHQHRHCRHRHRTKSTLVHNPKRNQCCSVWPEYLLWVNSFRNANNFLLFSQNFKYDGRVCTAQCGQFYSNIIWMNIWINTSQKFYTSNVLCVCHLQVHCTLCTVQGLKNSCSWWSESSTKAIQTLPPQPIAINFHILKRDINYFFTTKNNFLFKYLLFSICANREARLWQFYRVLFLSLIVFCVWYLCLRFSYSFYATYVRWYRYSPQFQTNHFQSTHTLCLLCVLLLRLVHMYAVCARCTLS